jgi:hypothetical protein
MSMIMAKVVLHTNEMEVFNKYTAITNVPTFSKILELQITMTSVIVIRKKHGTSYHWLT